jgi:3,4-dihydroxy 2-butanone 4-phosphate synthase / GTP cyclohydrolase II
MDIIADAGRGVVVLLRDTDMRMTPEEGDAPRKLRQYGVGAQILAALGVGEMTLLTNSPAPRVVGLDGYGLTILGTQPIA